MTHPLPARGARTTGKNRPFVMTPTYDLLLRDLQLLQRATAEQLTRLHYKPGMLTTVKARLKELADAGYVLPLYHPSIRLPYMYALARRGLTYLAAQGVEVKDYFRPSTEKETERNFLFREHMLLISDLIVAAYLFVRSEPTYQLERVLHERYFKNNPLKATVVRNNREETKTIVPDCYLEFVYTPEYGEEQAMPVLWELDRGTEEQKFFRRKIAAYALLLKNRVLIESLHVKHMTIAFATTKEHHRVEKLREWTRLELSQLHEASWLQQLFLITALPDPQQASVSPRQLFLDPVWYLPVENKPVSLL
jgi:hypothetical protein